MQSISPFSFAPMPHIHFGWGIRNTFLETVHAQNWQNIVLITGLTHAQDNSFGQRLLQHLAKQTRVQHFIVSTEPSPSWVDQTVQQCSPESQLVIGLGGGSVMDAAKAIAGLIPSQTSVMDYLEGVGRGLAFNQPTCAFIALPTTAGTGSETTKNAVLSNLGEFKKSFRSERLLAQQAWLDPELLTTCPKDVLYATGMDAFTQLLEAYTTPKANPLTDALAWQGLQAFQGAFTDIESDHLVTQQDGYSRLMLAATLSGTALANAGLGAVHGLAGPIGAFFEAPHGIVCARLLAPITQFNIEQLKTERHASAQHTLKKYQHVARLFNPNLPQEQLLDALIAQCQNYARHYTKQGLAEFGLTKNNLDPVLKACRSGSMLGNPVELSDQQLKAAMLAAL